MCGTLKLIKINIQKMKRKQAEWYISLQESDWIYFVQYPFSDKDQQQMFGEEAGGVKHRIISSLSRGNTGRFQRFVVQEFPALELVTAVEGSNN